MSTTREIFSEQLTNDILEAEDLFYTGRIDEAALFIKKLLDTHIGTFFRSSPSECSKQLALLIEKIKSASSPKNLNARIIYAAYHLIWGQELVGFFEFDAIHKEFPNDIESYRLHRKLCNANSNTHKSIQLLNKIVKLEEKAAQQKSLSKSQKIIKKPQPSAIAQITDLNLFAPQQVFQTSAQTASLAETLAEEVLSPNQTLT
jgi:hypothetical protein